MALHAQGNSTEAVCLLRNVVTMRRDPLETQHPVYAYAVYHLGEVLTGAGRLEEAELVIREALAIYRKTVGDRHRRTAYCLE